MPLMICHMLGRLEEGGKMITCCLRCEGRGCAYCYSLGWFENAEFNPIQDRMLKEAFEEITRLKILLSDSQNYLSTWRDDLPTKNWKRRPIQALIDDITKVLVS
jgi:hypothetical protein